MIHFSIILPYIHSLVTAVAHSGFLTEILFAYLVFTFVLTCPIDLILRSLITAIILCEEHKLRSSSVCSCLRLPVSPYFLDTNILPCILFSKTANEKDRSALFCKCRAVHNSDVCAFETAFRKANCRKRSIALNREYGIEFCPYPSRSLTQSFSFSFQYLLPFSLFAPFTLSVSPPSNPYCFLIPWDTSKHQSVMQRSFQKDLC